jgi:hypothetical protein
MSLSTPNKLVIALAILLAAAPGTASYATTKGLNQIVTPDIQPKGVLSISGQDENAALGNPQQLQLELGLTDSSEVAVFQGLSPEQTVFNAELGLVQKKNFLLSTGLVGAQTEAKYQPFLEGGYYTGKAEIIAGIQRQNGAYLGVFGASYQALPRLLIAADYISGSSNFATAGVTYAISPTLSFNPALYISNQGPHRAFGYGVLSWNVKIW